jgi:ribonuclease P protein component
VLPRVHRISDGVELRRVSRKGVRHATPFFVAAVARTEGPTRFGFVVSKQVGGAVVRNKVKRRLRDLALRSITASPTGRDVVIRALPPSRDASFAELTMAWDQVLAP